MKFFSESTAAPAPAPPPRLRHCALEAFLGAEWLNHI